MWVAEENWWAARWFDFGYALSWTALTSLWSFRCEGSRHMPRRGPALVVANHESYLDPVIVGLGVRRPLCYLARHGLFRNRALGALIRSLGAVPLEQENVNARQGLRVGAELLRAGRALLVFPEGERSPDGRVRPFLPGVLLLLSKAPVPVVPVGVAGAFEAYPRQARLPRFSPLVLPANGRGLAVSVGRPIHPGAWLDGPREEVLGTLARAVARQAERAERLRRKL